MAENAILLHLDYLEEFEELTKEEVGELVLAMMKYQAYGEVPELDRTMSLIFKSFKRTIDRDNEAYLKRCEVNRGNGKKGGRPKREESVEPPRTLEEAPSDENPTKPMGFSQNPKKAIGFSENPKNPLGYFGFFENPTKPNLTELNPTKPKKPNKKENIEIELELENELEEELELDKENIKEKSKKEKVTRFSPPSVEDVREYCFERGNSVDPQHFVDFYESKGWMVGKNKMKDWKSAVRTWEQRSKEQNVFDMWANA